MQVNRHHDVITQHRRHDVIPAQRAGNLKKKARVEKKSVEMPGIEPGASHMRSERSTTELHPPQMSGNKENCVHITRLTHARIGSNDQHGEVGSASGKTKHGGLEVLVMSGQIDEGDELGGCFAYFFCTAM